MHTDLDRQPDRQTGAQAARETRVYIQGHRQKKTERNKKKSYVSRWFDILARS